MRLDGSVVAMTNAAWVTYHHQNKQSYHYMYLASRLRKGQNVRIANHHWPPTFIGEMKKVRRTGYSLRAASHYSSTSASSSAAASGAYSWLSCTTVSAASLPAARQTVAHAVGSTGDWDCPAQEVPRGATTQTSRAH